MFRSTIQLKFLSNAMETARDYKKEIQLGAAVAVVGSLGAFVFSRYRTSRANEWIAQTGLFIEGTNITKKCLVLPFQEAHTICLNPRSIECTVAAMTKEKLEFVLPMNVIVGPKEAEQDLLKFASQLLHQDEMEINELIRGVLEGEIRTTCSNLTMEEIAEGREAFKTMVTNVVQQQLAIFGLEVKNANIKELSDSAQGKYFKFRSQRIMAEVENMAKAEVAEQRRNGDVAEAERDAERRTKVSAAQTIAIEAENVNARLQFAAKAQTSKIESEQQLITQFAKIDAENKSLIKEAEMQQQLQIQRAFTETEKQRAKDMSAAVVAAEVLTRRTEAAAQTQVIEAEAKAKIFIVQANADAEALKTKQNKATEADAYTIEKKAIAEADSILKLANAQAAAQLTAANAEAECAVTLAMARAKAVIAEADAERHKLEQVAAGEREKLTAEAMGQRLMVESLNGNVQKFVELAMVQHGTFEKVASENANAIRGMEPKFNIWTTGAAGDGLGSGGGAAGEAMRAIEALPRALFPMMDIVKQQTGIDLPQLAKDYLMATASSSSNSSSSDSNDHETDESRM